jgi:hypothetical protein
MENLILERLGITTEVTADNADEILSEIQNKIIESKMNDETFLQSIDIERLPQVKEALKVKLEEGEKKALYPLQRHIKSELGLTDEDIKTIGVDFFKEPKKFLAEAKKVAFKNISGSTEDLIKLQDQLSEYQKKVEEIQNEKESAIEAVKLEHETKLNEYATERLIADINVSNFKDKVKLNTSSLFELIYPKLKSRYDFRIIDGIATPFQKGKDLKVSKDGRVGEFMTVVDLLESEYKLMDALKENIDAPRIINVPMGGNKTTTNKLIEEALAREEAMLKTK